MSESAQPASGRTPSLTAQLDPDPSLEDELTQAIEPWLLHMTWRKDFASWRDRRIRQEDYQAGTVDDIRRALGGSLAGKAVLDLGAGMGGLSVALLVSATHEEPRLQAMDYNPDYCRIARLRARRYGIELPIVVAAGESLPYPANTFDAVVCLDVLEHVADPYGVLSEMFRVLRPGGVVLTTVPNRHAFRDPHYHLPVINWLPRPMAEAVIRIAGRSKQGSLLHDRQALSELHTYSWAGFRKLARSVGFRVFDQVRGRIMHGEIRQLTGWRRQVLQALLKSKIAAPLYAVYRYGWEGTYQIKLLKPR